MNFYDYEDYIEPSEADMIIDNAVDEFKNHLTDRAKYILKEVEEGNKQLRDLSTQIRCKEQLLMEAEIELDKLTKKVIEEKHNMPKKYIQQFIHDSIGNYAPGDHAWIITGKNILYDRCKGNEKIKVKVLDTDEFIDIDCPNCNGYGSIYKPKILIKEIVITEIKLILCFEDDRVSYWNKECIYGKYVDKPCSDGFSIDFKNLYSTKEEAENALREFNDFG